MKIQKYLVIAAALVVCISFSGCTATTGSLEVKEQPDKEAIWGEWVKDYYPSWREHYWVDKELWGNRGYIFGNPPPLPEEKFAGIRKERKVIVDEKIEAPTITVVEEMKKSSQLPLASEEYKAEKPKPTQHIVKKGECLWYIAGYKEIYANPLQWPRIYKANRDKIKKDPDLIYPGQNFVIPRD